MVHKLKEFWARLTYSLRGFRLAWAEWPVLEQGLESRNRFEVWFVRGPNRTLALSTGVGAKARRRYEDLIKLKAADEVELFDEGVRRGYWSEVKTP
jgi:hypothetical protein